jgi:hypothetical protein
VLPYAQPGERAGLLSAYFVVGYLSFSLPALAAGFLAPIVGLTRTADFYGIGVILLAITSLAITLYAAGAHRSLAVMVRAPFRRVRETRRELNAKVPTRPTRMLAMPPRDGVLDGIRLAFGVGGIESPTCIGNRAKLALRKSRAVATMHTPIVRWSAIRGRPLPRRQPSPDTSSK